MAKKQNHRRLCLWTHVQNEAHIISKMLQSAVDYIDYWVIVDNGSTDGTQQIIKDFFEQHGIDGKLYQNEDGWVNPGINRQYAWEKLCKTDHFCDYILRIDADEALHVDSDFDWSSIQDEDAYQVIYNSGGGIIPRMWLWNSKLDWYWKNDSAHETIHLKDGGCPSQPVLPYAFRHISTGKGNSYSDPIKFIKDVLKLEIQTHERFRDGATEEDEMYHLYYLCRSFIYAGMDINSDWAYKFFPYGKSGLEMFLRKGVYYHEQFINILDPNADELWVSLRNLGLIHQRLNEPEKALEAYEKAHAVRGIRPEPLYRLYHIHKQLGNIDSVLHYAKKIKNCNFDIMSDPYDVELFAMYSMNNNLKSEIDSLLQVDSEDTPIRQDEVTLIC